MSSTYPKVHVVGSGAYYSYRPITRFIEKVERNHIRDNSSRPTDFTKYMSASTSRGDGYSRRRYDDADRDFFRASSMPPLDTGRETKKSTRRDEDFQRRKGFDDSFMTDEGDNFSKRESAFSRRAERSLRQEEELTSDKKALFSNSEDVLSRLRRKHPYRLPVENEVVPPHESSVWPENRPHFDLVSSYDVMMDYLGIRDKSQK